MSQSKLTAPMLGGILITMGLSSTAMGNHMSGHPWCSPGNKSGYPAQAYMPPHPHWGPMYGGGYGKGHGHHGYGMQRPGGYGYGKPGAKAYGKAEPAAYSTGKSAAPAADKDIVDTALAAEGFSALVAAVKAAELVDTLKGEGPFTVFAPNDAAFEKLPEGYVASLLEDKTKLTEVLTYHVVPGRLTAADLLEKREVETVQGGTVKLDQLSVAKADVEASNGVIHVIDEVLVPKK